MVGNMNMKQIVKRAFFGLVVASNLVGGIGVATVAAAPGGPRGHEVAPPSEHRACPHGRLERCRGRRHSLYG